MRCNSQSEDDQDCKQKPVPVSWIFPCIYKVDFEADTENPVASERVLYNTNEQNNPNL